MATYIDPDFYPPTINAILNLAESFDEVIVLSRNNAAEDFPYPANVFLKKIGIKCTVREMEKQSVWQKVHYFLLFCFHFLRLCKSRSTQLVVLYEYQALYAFYLSRNFGGKHKVWYHNHDMPDSNMPKFSISGYAAKNELEAMKHVDYFSLPSKERMIYYPVLKKDLPVFILPNYPSKKVYNNLPQQEHDGKEIQIIYQGFIGPGRSLEQLMDVLKLKIGNQSLHLILKGSVTEEYKTSLDKLAVEKEVTDKITWLPVGPYSELPAITAFADIGIGINSNTDNVSLALGTASNKIYEYAACGIPVLLYDSPQFREYLGKYDWAFFTDGSASSLERTILSIIPGLENYKKSARRDFENELNFEAFFLPVLKKIKESIDG